MGLIPPGPSGVGFSLFGPRTVLQLTTVSQARSIPYGGPDLAPTMVGASTSGAGSSPGKPVTAGRTPLPAWAGRSSIGTEG
jgi:hypothetical protein